MGPKNATLQGRHSEVLLSSQSGSILAEFSASCQALVVMQVMPILAVPTSGILWHCHTYRANVLLLWRTWHADNVLIAFTVACFNDSIFIVLVSSVDSVVSRRCRPGSRGTCSARRTGFSMVTEWFNAHLYH